MRRLVFLALLGTMAFAMASEAGFLEQSDDVTVAWFNTEPEAVCSTDTECAAFCPLPADDPECDGGPQ